MIADFRLPDLGEGLPEAELVQWLVAVGEEIALNQPIAEVETAKAIVELPSPYAGRISALHADPGDVVLVGSVVVSVDVGADPDAPKEAEGPMVPEAPEPDPEDAPVAHLVGYGASPSASARPRRRARLTGSVAGPRAVGATSDLAGDLVGVLDRESRPAGRPRATPPVRALARERGVDLASTPATGVDGAVTRADVEAFAARMSEEGASAPRALTSGDARVTRIPIRGVRKHTAEAMVRSAFTAPHATVFLTVDVTATMDFLAGLREERALQGHRIGILAVAAKAVCLALPRQPMLNATWDGDAGEIVQFHDIGLGIAAATERGLVVPAIPDAGRLTLVELADSIGELARAAREGRSTPGALAGGTFSITNVGIFGIDAGTPLLNPGQAGILALGAVRRQPWEHRGQVALRDVLTLSLSFDHRMVDGEQGAAFLVDVGAVLRDPARSMLLR